MFEVFDEMALCPRCNGDATHIDDVDIVNAGGQHVTLAAHGEDESAHVTLKLGKRSGKYGGRRHTITLRMYCEQCGAYTSFHLKQHKGTTYVSTT